MPLRARPPSSRSSECASSVLPAPVSPVTTFSPGPRRSSARSSSNRFSTRSSSSTREVLSGGDDGSLGRSRQAAELVAQPPVERGAGNLREMALTALEARLQPLARREHAYRASIDADIDGLLLGAIADDQDVVGGDDQRAGVQ